MPVTIPEVKRFNPVDPASVGRVNVAVPDGAKSFAQGAEQLQHLAAAGVDYMNQVEDQAIDTQTTDSVNKYEIGRTQELDKMKYNEGDPTPLYNKFDEDSKKLRDEMLGDEKLSDRAKRILAKKLTDTSNRLEMHRLSQYGAQNAKYEDGVSDSKVALLKNGIIEASALPDIKNSFAAIDKTIGDIEQERIGLGVKRGSVTPDEKNGDAYHLDAAGNPVKVKLGSAAKVELGKDLSEGLHDMMDNLIKTKQIDKAKQMKERYWSYLDPKRKTDLADNFQKADDKYLAGKVAMDPKAINEIKDPVRRREIQAAADQINLDSTRNRASLVEAQQKVNFQFADKRLQTIKKELEKSGGAVTKTLLQNDPVLAKVYDKMSTKQQEALLDDAVERKVTTPEVDVAFNKLISGQLTEKYPNGLRGLPAEEFLTFKQGMSNADKAKADTLWRQANTESDNEQGERYKYVVAKTKEVLAAAKILKTDIFGNIKHNQDATLAAESAVIKALDARGSGPMTPKEQDDFAKSFSLDYAVGKAFVPPPRPKFQGTKELPKTVAETKPAAPVTAALKPNANGLIKGKSYKDWMILYRAANGGHSPLSMKDPAFLKFIDEKGN